MSEGMNQGLGSQTKTCRKCGQEKLLSEYYQSKSDCKICAKAYSIEWQRNNRDKKNAYARAGYAKNREALIGRVKAYRGRNRDKVNAYKRAYRAQQKANKPPRIMPPSQAKWTPEEKRQYYREYNHAYAERHKDGIRLRRQAYRLAHRDQEKAREDRRRVRLLGNGVERVSYAFIRNRDKMRCHICGKQIREADLSYDHLIPVSLGGPHAEWNLALAHLKCNIRRGAGRTAAQLHLAL